MSDASSKTNPIRAFGVVLGSVSIFLLAQVVGVFLLAIVLAIMGWSPERTSDWLVKSSTGQFLVVLLVEVATVGLVMLALKRLRRSSRVLKLNRTPAKTDITAVVAGFAAYFALGFIIRVLVDLFVPAVDLEQGQQIGFSDASGGALIFVFLALCLLVPIGEEILFRGLLFQGLKKYLNLRSAAVMTSIIFGIAHLEFFGDSPLNFAAALDTTVFSMVLIWVFIKSGNLWAPIGLHILKNSVAFMFLFLL